MNLLSTVMYSSVDSAINDTKIIVFLPYFFLEGPYSLLTMVESIHINGV